MKPGLLNKINRHLFLIRAVICLFIFIWQFGLIHSFALQAAVYEDSLVPVTDSYFAISTEQINSTGVVSQITEAAKLNDVISHKFDYKSALTFSFTFDVNKKLLSVISTSNEIFIESDHLIYKVHPRSPPSVI